MHFFVTGLHVLTLTRLFSEKKPHIHISHRLNVFDIDSKCVGQAPFALCILQRWGRCRRCSIAQPKPAKYVGYKISRWYLVANFENFRSINKSSFCLTNFRLGRVLLAVVLFGWWTSKFRPLNFHTSGLYMRGFHWTIVDQLLWRYKEYRPAAGKTANIHPSVPTIPYLRVGTLWKMLNLAN